MILSTSTCLERAYYRLLKAKANKLKVSEDKNTYMISKVTKLDHDEDQTKKKEFYFANSRENLEVAQKPTCLEGG